MIYKLKYLIVFSFFATALLGASFGTHAQTNASTPTAVLFYADWCGSCKILDPKVEEARKNSAAQGIDFVKLDMTDQASRQKSKQLAETKGLTKLLDTYGYGTGFMVIYDKKNDKVIKTITSSQNTTEIVSAFKKASGA